MSEILKPCPFCGGNKLTFSRYFGLNCYTVRCINEDCGMKVVTDFAKTKKEAIELWNTRPNPWHTEPPTEVGWYLVQFNSKTSLSRAFGAFDLDELLFYMKDEGFVKYATVKVVAWQKIEPYEGRK